MRKRRMYRYAAQQKAARSRVEDIQQMHPYQAAPAAPAAPDGAQYFNSGIRRGIEMAQQQQGRVIAEARRNALVAAQNEPHLIMARQSGFDRGFAAGMQASSKAGAPKDSQFTYQDVETARRRGFEEGKATKGAIPNVDEKSVRKKICDQMFEQCRVIAESNPSMAPGVNAVKRQIRKHVLGE